MAGIALRKEEVSFDVKLRAVVSTRLRDVPGPPGWAGFDEPLDATDSGWSITAGDEPEDFFADDKKVGLDGGTCVLVRLPAWFHCVATNKLPKGDLQKLQEDTEKAMKDNPNDKTKGRAAARRFLRSFS